MPEVDRRLKIGVSLTLTIGVGLRVSQAKAKAGTSAIVTLGDIFRVKMFRTNEGDQGSLLLILMFRMANRSELIGFAHAMNFLPLAGQDP